MLIVAALLLSVMAVFHTVIGEKFVLQPIKANNNLPKMWDSRKFTFRTIQATWHLVSVLWIGLAGYLIALELSPANSGDFALIIFGVIFGVLAIVPLVWESGKHKSWIPFSLISILLFAKFYIG